MGLDATHSCIIDESDTANCKHIAVMKEGGVRASMGQSQEGKISTSVLLPYSIIGVGYRAA